MTTKPRGCGCVARLNGELAEHNLRISTPIAFGEQTLAAMIPITTHKVDPKKRGRASTLYASFCPFCGVNLRGDAA